VEAGTRRLMEAGKGLIVVTMHLGHWDLGLKLLTAYSLPVHVVMLSEDPEEVTRYADEARRTPGLTVHRAGQDPLLAVELMLALKRGELVAIQADRPVGKNSLPTPLFGAPAPLPTGPVQLAMATGAPLLPAFVLLDRGRQFRLLTLPPIYFEKPRAGTEEAALREGMLRMARMMERAASQFPDQWFNFYDVWPEPARSGDDGRNDV
jgi:KDO2-lipid IV(A) lauroyltransferase